MITFKIQGITALGKLDRQKFTVPGEPATESILNSVAAVHPVLNGGCPDPDYQLFRNVAAKWPFLEIVSRDEPPPRIEGRIY
jgi:hypothetical protein